MCLRILFLSSSALFLIATIRCCRSWVVSGCYGPDRLCPHCTLVLSHQFRYLFPDGVWIIVLFPSWQHWRRCYAFIDRFPRCEAHNCCVNCQCCPWPTFEFRLKPCCDSFPGIVSVSPAKKHFYLLCGLIFWRRSPSESNMYPFL